MTEGEITMLHDRYDQGTQLGRALVSSGAKTSGTVVVGIPRGGVLVAASAALEMGLEYECVPVCRIAVPCFPDLTLGAIDADGVATFDPGSQLTQHEFAKARGPLAVRLKQQADRCRGDRPPVDFHDRDVVVIDESATSPLALQAAANYLLRHGARHLSLALPVAVKGVTDELRPLYGEITVLAEAPAAQVVGWYGTINPSDDEIRDCMIHAWNALDTSARA